MTRASEAKYRVLIPSDNRDFVAELALGYSQAGCDVVTGAFNFDLCLGGFDLVHHQWPEEFCNWIPPTDARLSEIVGKLRWWNERSASIVSIHNLWPHGYPRHPQFRRMFDEFYTGCTRLLHFTETSKTKLIQEFTTARHDRHIMSHLWNFENTVLRQSRRGPCREELGLQSDEFVVLVFGALRSWAEVRLLRGGFSLCQVRKKRLLAATRYFEEPPLPGQRWRKLRWRSWLWWKGAARANGFIPDEELWRYFDSADVVVIPRNEELNSGVPSLAASFGTPIVAPNVGVFAEVLGGTQNVLYKPGSAVSLAEALEVASRIDRSDVRSANVQLSKKWNCRSIAEHCLNALDRRSATLTESTERMEG